MPAPRAVRPAARPCCRGRHLTSRTARRVPLRPPGPPPPARPGAGPTSRLPAAALLLLAGLTCFAHLGTASASEDETTYIAAGRAYLRGQRTLNLEHPYLAKQLIGLSMRLFGDSLVAARLPAALLGALTAPVLCALARRLGGRPAGWCAAALWLALPQAPGTIVVNLDRYAALDPVMVFLSTGAVWLALRARDRRSPRTALLAGGCVGLAASAKLPGALALLPVLAAVLPLARDRRALPAGVVLSSLVGLWLPYAVQGDPAMSGLGYALRFQARHDRVGHPQVVAGTVYQHAPAWANWWWQSTYLGWGGVLGVWVLAGVGLSVAARRRGPADVLPVALALGSAVLFVGLVGLRLPHYHLLWSGMLDVAAAVGLLHLLRAAGAARALGLLLLLPLAAAALGNLGRVVTLQPADYARVPTVLAAAGVDRGQVAVWGWPAVAAAHLPARFRAVRADLATRPVAVVVDPVVADRQQQAPVARDVARLVQGCTRRAVDRLEVYVC